MDSMTTQKDLADFLKTPRNAQKVNDLVEDIRYALMNYQVRIPKMLTWTYLIFATDVVTAGHLRRGLSADREFHSLTVAPFVVTCK